MAITASRQGGEPAESCDRAIASAASSAAAARSASSAATTSSEASPARSLAASWSSRGRERLDDLSAGTVRVEREISAEQPLRLSRVGKPQPGQPPGGGGLPRHTHPSTVATQTASAAQGRCSWNGASSVDVELVALGVFHRDRVVVEPLRVHDADQGGAKIAQPPRLGVDALPPGFARNRAPAADMYVEVPPVLDRFPFWHHLEPDARPAAIRVDDAVLTDSQVFLAHSEVAPVVVPCGEASRGWLKLISQSGGPETGKPVRIGAVDHQLEADSHWSLPKSRSMFPPVCPKQPDSPKGTPTDPRTADPTVRLGRRLMRAGPGYGCRGGGSRRVRRLRASRLTSSSCTPQFRRARPSWNWAAARAESCGRWPGSGTRCSAWTSPRRCSPASLISPPPARRSRRCAWTARSARSCWPAR